MALETFNYLDSLVAANPDVNDGLVNGDDHIRGIKLTLKNTFPNITGAVTATQADLNTVAGGASVLSASGAFFKTNTTDGFLNSVAGDIDVQLQGVVAATFQRTGGANFLKVNGGISATGEIKGPGITPIGAAVMWFDDTLPSDGLWAWANGQVIANANTVAPVLLARWGNRFGGNGTTTMGLPNMQEVVPVGKSGMGGAAAPGLLSSISSSLKAVIGALFGSDTHTLSVGEMPSHTHGVNDPGHTHNVTSPGWFGSGNGATTGGSQSTPIITALMTSIGLTSNATGISIQYQGGGSAFNITQPSRTVNWIIRIG